MNTLYDVYLFKIILTTIICAIIWLQFRKKNIKFIRIFSAYYFITSSLLITAFSFSTFIKSKCAMLSVGVPSAFFLSYILSSCIAFYSTKTSIKNAFLPLVIFGIFTSLFAELLISPGMESYFIFNPQIDTIYSANFSKQKFSAIKKGMFKSEVKRFLGEPFSIYGNETEPTWLFSNDGGCGHCDAAWQQWTITFKNNQVVNKSVGWACD